ncbi:MAG: hypothetical protein IJD65_04905 [Mailhella sp.]|nr:hypothetical protein [Mailhella sp.]
MLFYLLCFCGLGFALGVIVENRKLALSAIILISLGWAFVYGPWAIATFVELLVGYAVAILATKIAQKDQ